MSERKRPPDSRSAIWRGTVRISSVVLPTPSPSRMREGSETSPLSGVGRSGVGRALLKVIGVGLKFQLLRRCRMNPRGDPVFFSIGFRGIFRRESQLDLRLRVTASRPTHKRIGLARLGLLKFEHPIVNLGFAGLHGAFGCLIYDRGHSLGDPSLRGN